MIKKKFMNNKIKITKYNYAIDENVQTSSTFDGYLQLSKDEKNLEIMLKKYILKPDYVLEADPDTVKRAQERYEKEQNEKLGKLNSTKGNYQKQSRASQVKQFFFGDDSDDPSNVFESDDG